MPKLSRRFWIIRLIQPINEHETYTKGSVGLQIVKSCLLLPYTMSYRVQSYWVKLTRAMYYVLRSHVKPTDQHRYFECT